MGSNIKRFVKVLLLFFDFFFFYLHSFRSNHLNLSLISIVPKKETRFHLPSNLRDEKKLKEKKNANLLKKYVKMHTRISESIEESPTNLGGLHVHKFDINIFFSVPYTIPYVCVLISISYDYATCLCATKLQRDTVSRTFRVIHTRACMCSSDE